MHEPKGSGSANLPFPILVPLGDLGQCWALYGFGSCTFWPLGGFGRAAGEAVRPSPLPSPSVLPPPPPPGNQKREG